MPSLYDYIYKFIVIGDSGVGKSAISNQYSNHEFSQFYDVTIGVEYCQKVIVADDNTRIKIQIWDTAGQEVFRSITAAYYKGVACALVVYDISNRQSFNNIPLWVDNVKKMCPPNIIIALVGNKKDKVTRSVSYEEGKKFADKHELLFFESSAKNYEDVDEIFVNTSNIISHLVSSNKIRTSGEFGVKRINNEPQYINTTKATSTTKRFKWCTVL